MDRIDRDGFQLAATVSGREGPDAPVLLLSNSLAATQAMWRPQLPLLEATHRVIRYDTRGHGGSDAPPGPYAFDDLVADMAAVLDHYGAARASIMGLSLGGMTALGFALTHAERLEKLVVAAARADAPEPFVKSWDDRVAMIEAGGLASILNGTMDRWLTQRFRAAEPDAVQAVEAMILSTKPAGYIGCAAALKTLDYLPRLGAIAAPTLYIAGSEDMGAPAAAMRAMAEATPGSEYVEIADAAHIVNMDQAEAFNAALDRFLGA